jgi:carboxypeptidase T
MKWFQRTCINLGVICVVVGVLTSALYATPPSDRCILIKVQVADRDDVATLANMGLDIWKYREGGLNIRVTDDERKQIIENGFAIETITEDVYEYTEKIRQEQISMFAEPTSAKYHSYDEVITELIALEDSGVARTYIIGSTHEGRDILAVKISDNPSEDENEPGALFFGGQHAREWIAKEVPLYIAQYLTDNYETDAEVKHLVDNCEIWIVPLVNPDGYEYSRTVDRMWRKNRRDNGDGTFGVDLNRNWSYMWGGPNSSSNTNNNGYRGPSAFSEPETQAIRDLALAHDFEIMMDYHSWGQVTAYPWAYTPDPCPDNLPMSAMTSMMRELIKQTSGAVYFNWWDWFGAYAIGGDAGDWAYGELGIYSFLFELGPESEGPIPSESLINIICEENLPAALYLISYATADYGIENLTTGKTYSNIQIAINDANDGDEIVVDSGVYHENIDFIDKNLTLRSIDPNDPNVVASTVINIEDSYQGSVITLSGRRNGVCELAGLTITGGQVSISCCDASPTIRDCTVASNGPNAIEFWEDCEPPTIIDCTILGQVVEVNDPTLVAHWPLDETEGVVVTDSAGDDNGDALGDAIWEPDGGHVGGAIRLDGVDDYIAAGPALNPADGPFSILAWVKGGGPGQAVISEPSGVNWLMTDAEGKLMTELTSGGRSGGPLLSQAVITDDAWHRIGLVWDGANRTLYVDSVAVAQDMQNSLRSSSNGLNIGCGASYEPNSFFSGLIDDVRIYNRVVTP